MIPLLALTLLTGCSKEQTDAYWIQGAGYGWDLFNHRVSHLHWDVDADGRRAAIIGGTSTTGVPADLPDECESSSCQELPFLDDSEVQLRWVHASSKRTVFARGSAELLADAGGVSTSVSVPLPRKAKGDPVAFIAGLTFDTDAPLSGGDACYDPSFGWHPRQIALTLGTPTLDDGRESVTVPVTATFAAGESFEDIRQCIDAVNDQAQVAVDVQIVVAVTRDGYEHHDVSHGMTYTLGDGAPGAPDEQPPPDMGDRPLAVGVANPVLGWSSLDFSFYGSESDGHGAYIRTLSWDADADEGWASGHATNYSPVTQLDGFEYDFTGTVVALEMADGQADGDTSTAVIPAELDDDGVPVIFDVDEAAAD